MISSTLSRVLYSFPNRRPLDCVDETMQEEVKVMLSPLGKVVVIFAAKSRKCHTAQKGIVPLTKTFGT